MKTETSRARHNREKLLRTALKLFGERGFKKVSVQDIAAAADLVPATVYNHFGTKEALVRETLAYYLNDMLETSRRIMESDLPFDVKLEQLLRAGAEVYDKDRREFLRLMVSDDPEIRRIAEAFQASKQNQRWVEEFFEEGKRVGAIDPDLSTESVIRYSNVIREGVIAMARQTDEPGFLPRLLEELTPLYLYGIMMRPQAGPPEHNDREVST